MIVEKIIATDNLFTDELIIPNLTDPQKKTSFNLSITGDFVATITVKRKLPSASIFRDVDTFTAPTESVGDEVESGTKYIVGVNAGDYTSGTVTVRLGVN